MREHKLKITINSPVILTFGLLCVVATLLNNMTNGQANVDYFMTYRSSLFEFGTYIRLFTHVLGHTNWSHLIGNMSYVLLLGPLLEEKYGSGLIVGMILIVAFVTAVFNAIFFPSSALLGASGICFAFILLSSFTSVKTGEIPITFILVAAIYIGQQVYQGIFVQDDIANFAHIIGGIVGAFFGFVRIRDAEA